MVVDVGVKDCKTVLAVAVEMVSVTDSVTLGLTVIDSLTVGNVDVSVRVSTATDVDRVEVKTLVWVNSTSSVSTIVSVAVGLKVCKVVKEESVIANVDNIVAK